jgi:hypothetical protein
VYRWVAAPDAENSQKCLDTGNECPDTPAGLLSLAAFWAYGDLMPVGEQTVPTPPGLAANGLCQVLLMCALHQGGTRKLKERYAEYFRLGVEVFTGADNWEASLADRIMPHEKIEPAGPARADGNSAAAESGPSAAPAGNGPAAAPGVNGQSVPAPEKPANGEGEGPQSQNGANGGSGFVYKRWKPGGETP